MSKRSNSAAAAAFLASLPSLPAVGFKNEDDTCYCHPTMMALYYSRKMRSVIISYKATKKAPNEFILSAQQLINRIQEAKQGDREIDATPFIHTFRLNRKGSLAGGHCDTDFINIIQLANYPTCSSRRAGTRARRPRRSTSSCASRKHSPAARSSSG